MKKVSVEPPRVKASGSTPWGQLLVSLMRPEDFYLKGSFKGVKKEDAMEAFIEALPACNSKNLDQWLKLDIMKSEYWDNARVMTEVIKADWVEGYEVLREKGVGLGQLQLAQNTQKKGVEKEAQLALKLAVSFAGPNLLAHLWKSVPETERTHIVRHFINPKAYKVLMTLGKEGVLTETENLKLAMEVLALIQEKKTADTWEKEVLQNLYKSLNDKSTLYVWLSALRGSVKVLTSMASEGLLPSASPKLLCRPVDIFISELDRTKLPFAWHNRSKSSWTKEGQKEHTFELPEVAAIAYAGAQSDGGSVFAALMKDDAFKKAVIESPVAIHFLLVSGGGNNWEKMVRLGIPHEKIKTLDGENPLHHMCEGGVNMPAIRNVMRAHLPWCEQKNAQGKTPLMLFKGSDEDKAWLQSLIDEALIKRVMDEAPAASKGRPAQRV